MSARGAEPVTDLLIHGAELVATVDAARREIPGGWVAIADGVVTAVGGARDAPPLARRRINATGCLVTPGLVNVHHHMWQNLTRSYRPMTGADFLGWLAELLPLWSQLHDDDIYLSTRVALLELAMGGCTTTSDHLYLQPGGRASLLDAEVQAAQDSGLRFYLVRGAVDRTEQRGGPMPDLFAEEVDHVLADTERLVHRHHDPSPQAQMRVAIGPHSLFGATNQLMRASAALAEDLDIRLHTHLAADPADDEHCAAVHGCRPVEWLADAGWCSARTWVAHCNFPSDAEIGRLGAAGVGVAHCATAALLMGIGVCPVPALRCAGSPVGLGVDGSSNSDASSLWLEARMAYAAGRFRGGPAAMSARDVLEMATVGGAACLGWSGGIGELSPGACGDVAVWPLDGVQWAGAVSDPIEAWLRCGPAAPRHVVVGGEPVVGDGSLVDPGVGPLLARHRAAASRIQRC